MKTFTLRLTDDESAQLEAYRRLTGERSLAAAFKHMLKIVSAATVSAKVAADSIQIDFMGPK